MFVHLAKWLRNAIDWFEFLSQEYKLGPKYNFSQIWYFDCISFFIFLFTNIQIVPKAYLARSSKNMLQVFHKDIANLASPRNSFFFYWEFWVLLQLQWPCRAHKLGQRDFSLLGHSLKCPISCFYPRSCKNSETCILSKISVCGLIWVHPIPSGGRG